MVHERIQCLRESHPSSSMQLMIRILAADTGKIVKATLGISPEKHSRHDVTPRRYAHTEGTTEISGVPGTSAPVHVENPLVGIVLPTGQEQDVLNLEGKQVR